MKFPIDLAVEAYLEGTYPDEQVPLAYRNLIEVTFGDALIDVPDLYEWRASAERTEA